MTPKGVVRQLPNSLDLLACGEELERPDPEVTGGHPSQNRTRLRTLAEHAIPRGDGCESACGRNTQSMHRLTNQVLTQHRTEDRLAVSTA